MSKDLKKAAGPNPPKPAPLPKARTIKPGTSTPSTPRPSIMTTPARQPKVTVSVSSATSGLAKSDTFESLLASTTKAHAGQFHDPAQHDKDAKLEHFLEQRLKSKFSGGTLAKAEDDEIPGEPMRRQRVEHSANKKLSEYTPPAAKAPRNGPVPKTPNYKLLTPMESNAKTAKNEGVEGDEGQGHFSGILHLAPATLAGVGNVCEAATEGCRDACLNTAGRGGMFKAGENSNVIQDARVRKTRQLAENPGKFMDDLIHDVGQVRRHAQARGDKPVVRLNGTSDIAWEDLKLPQFGGKNIFEAHPDVQFYDYTKRPDRVMKNKHQNYHLTFSNSGKNEHISRRLLDAGHNVAAVFGGKKLPTEWNGHKVISGDEHDLRFLDPKGGVVVGLKAKGDAKGDKTGFVVWNHNGNPEGVGPKDLKQVKRAQVEGNLADKAKALFGAGKVQKSINGAGATGIGALKKDMAGTAPATPTVPPPLDPAATKSFMTSGGFAKSELKKDATAGGMSPTMGATPVLDPGGVASIKNAFGKSEDVSRSKNPAAEWHKPSGSEDRGLEKSGKWPVPGIVPPSGDKSQLAKSYVVSDKKDILNWIHAAAGKNPRPKDRHLSGLPVKPMSQEEHQKQMTEFNTKLNEGSKSLKKELVVDGFTPKPTGQKALDMIKGALDRRASNNVPKGQMSHEEMKSITDKLKVPKPPTMEKSQYAKTEPVEVREGKKAAKKKSDDQKARINQQLKTETLDYVANKNGARYQGLSSDSARKTTRGVDDKPAGSVTNPPKV